ncbi:MAG TPA: ImmA/IrrE family metallo-endopeptidase [Jatrophihabitantaceae bacterium]
MTADPINVELVRKYATATLNLAGARYTVPTPMEEIRQALQLVRADELDAMVANLKSRWLPDKWRAGKRRIARVRGFLAVRERIVYIDPHLRPTQARFVLGHEIGHDALPWQHAAYQVDDAGTLAPDVQEKFEREANSFAADLLFNIDELRLLSMSAPLSLTAPLELHTRFDASLIATTRRFVEDHHGTCALVLLGQHEVRSLGRPAARLMFGVQSAKFADRYGEVMRGLRLPSAWPGDYHDLAAACLDAIRGIGAPMTGGTYRTHDDDLFRFEVYRAAPFPFVFLTPRHVFGIGKPATRVSWGPVPQSKPPIRSQSALLGTGNGR